ncbi:MAG: hypothetical protein VYE22_31255 [Myxococcota bacterium]|nr:hypothetical protein [Myxococcota bacterium]
MLQKRFALWMMPLVALAAFGCSSSVGNDGAWVGGDCRVSGDCVIESVCRRGEDWPDGYCANSCDSDEDCLEGSRCVELEGGICVVECASDSECRPAEEATDTSPAVPAYSCVELEVRGAGGTAMGCAFQE